ncbi:MAG TPA: hypothetical protein VG387_19115 [Rhizomicrobium sp.]|jgi:hypothetical protein|nr:hypothetical protein [Rhizomicrobium sp.]
MRRAGFAILSVSIAALLLSAAAYGAGHLAPYLVHVARLAGPSTVAIGSSLFSVFFGTWVALRYRTKEIAAGPRP